MLDKVSSSAERVSAAAMTALAQLRHTPQPAAFNSMERLVREVRATLPALPDAEKMLPWAQTLTYCGVSVASINNGEWAAEVRLGINSELNNAIVLSRQWPHSTKEKLRAERFCKALVDVFTFW